MWRSGSCSPSSQTVLAAGSYSVVASYQGSADFGTSSATQKLTVTSP
jgi:hypothetical protein